VDSGVAQGDRVHGHFDAMIAKLVVWAPDRPQAVDRLSRALEAFVILGCRTNLPFLQAISRTQDFLTGAESTAWIGEHLQALNAPLVPAGCAAFFASRAFREALSCAFQGLGRPAPGPAERFAAQDHPELRVGSAQEQEAFRIVPGPEHRFTVDGPACQRALGPARTGQPLAFTACRLSGSAMGMAVFGDTLELQDPLAQLPAASGASAAAGGIQAPMGGRVVEVRVGPGETVEAGQLLFVLESMKMQFEILAPRDGRVISVAVVAGQVLQGPDTLAVLT
jgi:acetyl/propionyl-CoA carboxylase alpha subunit